MNKESIKEKKERRYGRKIFNIGIIVLLVMVTSWFYDAAANRRYLQREYIDLKDRYEVVAFGDSLTEGIGATDARGYVTRLSERYGIDILNRGIRRHQTKQLLARVETDVLPYKPKLVVMTVGGNDVLRGVPFETFSQNLSELFQIFKDNNIHVLYLGVTTSRFGDDNKEALAELCAQFDNVTYVPNILDGILFHPLRLSDIIHPDDAGYEIITDKVAPVFEQLLIENKIKFTKQEEKSLPPFDGPSLIDQFKTNVPIEFNRSYNPFKKEL